MFCGSLCDVFDNAVPGEWRRDLLKLIRATPNLDWLVLTKRIGNALNMLDADVPERFDPEDHPCAWPHLWLGATICNQEEADRDIPKLLAVPAAKRFLSIEPMLGPVDLSRWFDDGSNEMALATTLNRNGAGCWVICGGETGPNARPMRLEWVRSLLDQCRAAGVPYFFKQWGEWCPENQCDMSALEGKTVKCLAPDVDAIQLITGRKKFTPVWRVGKKLAGRLLDGREWNEVPA